MFNASHNQLLTRYSPPSVLEPTYSLDMRKNVIAFPAAQFCLPGPFQRLYESPWNLWDFVGSFRPGAPLFVLSLAFSVSFLMTTGLPVLGKRRAIYRGNS
jgi:hypothetical protein